MPSTAIRWIRYEAGHRRLIVGFQSGRRYAYDGVPGEVHDGFLKAGSRGAFFNKHIRDHYACVRLDN